jgi:beta-lactamase class A
MGKVKNVNLIKAGLPSSVDFIHKTGDIGTMLGDAGIVYLPSGQRYIVVILALRPHNNPNGKLFIQEASKIIYNYMSTQN